MRLVAAVAAVVGTWLVGLAKLPLNPLQVSAIWAGACGVAMLASRTTGARALWFNVAFVLLAVGGFDAYVASRAEPEQRRQTFGNAGELFVVDDTLGVRPAPGLTTTAKMEYRGRTIYDVVYSFDDAGLRVSPPEGDAATRDCVLFFGGSFTFGEGVRDEETMPYRVGVLAAGHYRVHNFGFSGYGPHQMLAAIESGFVERVAAGCEPRYAVYQAVYHHVLRAAGVWTWDRHGPRFVLRDDGTLERAGNFDSEGARVEETVGQALGDSAVGRQLRRRGMDVGAGEATEADVALFRAILDESRRRLQGRWPGLEMHVVYWDAYDNVGPYPLFDDRLRSGGIKVHPISEILPMRGDWEAAYRLPEDIHPSPLAHDLIAHYVAREILGLQAR